MGLMIGVFSWQTKKFNTLQKELKEVQASRAPKDSMLLNTKVYQALFLSNGQVYFGRVSEMNKDYVILTDIYYLNSTTPPLIALFFGAQSVSLTKLGCEMHGPEDTMVIRRDKIDFWENLKDSGEVVKAIKDFQRTNPKGQKCPTPPPDNPIKVLPSNEA